MNRADELLKLHEAATILRCDESTLRRWIADGTLPAYKLPGGHFRIARADLVLVLGPANGSDRREPGSAR